MDKKTPKKSSDLQSIIEKMKIARECPFCTEDYDISNITIVEERGDVNLIYTICPSCNNAVLSLLVVTDFGISCVGTITDLDVADIIRLKNKGPITEDFLLSFHTELESNCNDFIKTLKLEIKI